jgi:hypothetical protein
VICKHEPQLNAVGVAIRWGFIDPCYVCKHCHALFLSEEQLQRRAEDSTAAAHRLAALAKFRGEKPE